MGKNLIAPARHLHVAKSMPSFALRKPKKPFSFLVFRFAQLVIGICQAFYLSRLHARLNTLLQWEGSSSRQERITIKESSIRGTFIRKAKFTTNQSLTFSNCKLEWNWTTLPIRLFRIGSTPNWKLQSFWDEEKNVPNTLGVRIFQRNNLRRHVRTYMFWWAKTQSRDTTR